MDSMGERDRILLAIQVLATALRLGLLRTRLSGVEDETARIIQECEKSLVDTANKLREVTHG